MTDPNGTAAEVTPPTEAPTPESPTPEQISAYRARGRILPLWGIAACILFSLLVPVWYVFWGAAKDEAFTLVIIGILPSLLAIPFHILGSKRPQKRALWYTLSILLNTVGTSHCMTAYYAFLGVRPSATPLLAGALVSMVLYLLLALLIHLWPHRYPLLTGIVALLTVALMVVSIVFWVKNDNKVFFSFVFFNLLWSLISVCALHAACTDENSPAQRFASFASFGILMGVAVIVLVILACAAGDCDCDCGDCCDCSGGSGQSKKNSKSKAAGVTGATTAAIRHEIVDEVKKREKRKKDRKNTTDTNKP